MVASIRLLDGSWHRERRKLRARRRAPGRHIHWLREGPPCLLIRCADRVFEAGQRGGQSIRRHQLLAVDPEILTEVYTTSDGRWFLQMFRHPFGSIYSRSNRMARFFKLRSGRPNLLGCPLSFGTRTGPKLALGLTDQVAHCGMNVGQPLWSQTVDANVSMAQISHALIARIAQQPDCAWPDARVRVELIHARPLQQELKRFLGDFTIEFLAFGIEPVQPLPFLGHFARRRGKPSKDLITPAFLGRPPVGQAQKHTYHGTCDKNQSENQTRQHGQYRLPWIVRP
jgi:hypothetical protein